MSSTMELLIRMGLEIARELDFENVITAIQKREVPQEVRERARQRRARVLGGLSDSDVEELLKKARRTRR